MGGVLDHLVADLDADQLFGLEVCGAAAKSHGHEAVDGPAYFPALIVEYLVLGGRAAHIRAAGAGHRGLAPPPLNGHDPISVLVQNVAPLEEAAVLLAAEDADRAF